MRKSPERGAAPAMIFRTCAAAALLGIPWPARAAGVTGVLTADRTRVAEGGTIRLALTITAPGSAREYRVAQPVLPPLKRFNLISTGQRNEAVSGADGGTYSATFLYALRAKSAGTEEIPAIEVREEREEGVKGEKGPLLTVAGIVLTVEPAGRVVYRWGLAIAVIAGVAGAALAVSCLARRRPVPPPAPREAAESRRHEGAIDARAAMEDARAIRLSGDWGAYAARIHQALAACAARGGGAELSAIAKTIEGVCERVRYARDAEAERGIQECVRKAELILKQKIREGVG